jgi:hypothetical protein
MRFTYAKEGAFLLRGKSPRRIAWTARSESVVGVAVTPKAKKVDFELSGLERIFMGCSYESTKSEESAEGVICIWTLPNRFLAFFLKQYRSSAASSSEEESTTIKLRVLFVGVMG